MWELPSGLIIIFLFCFYFNNFFSFQTCVWSIELHIILFVFMLGIRVRTEIRKELCPCGTGLTHAVTTGWKEGPSFDTRKSGTEICSINSPMGAIRI